MQRGMGMFITDIKYYRYKTPLKKPFKTALRTVDVKIGRASCRERV